MIKTEQIFKYQDINVKYKFKPQSTDRNHLFVVFSGFGSNSESIYDFIGESALSVKGNILYIKDEFFGGATYYLCHNNDFTIEKSIIALINNSVLKINPAIHNPISESYSVYKYLNVKTDYQTGGLTKWLEF